MTLEISWCFKSNGKHSRYPPSKKSKELNHWENTVDAVVNILLKPTPAHPIKKKKFVLCKLLKNMTMNLNRKHLVS